ncbi:MAG: PspC domain-containing protein [Anaerolineae bacterium]|jgi:phage shock protein C|nr:PspC domain-containing protein [Anaerolineae bacterium]MBT7072124.1 PspC domain-containing protein [Anaerolineae bacterium]MBT7326773.1 PspC domain-containing protein [Anaerolineae bacterium]
MTTEKEPRPKLRRSRSNRVIAGICGGLAEFYDINVFWFRLAFVLAMVPGGIPGIGAYLIFWFIVPDAN